MTNPFNPLDWLSTAQDWFSKTEKSSGFRPFLIYLILSIGVGLALLLLFNNKFEIEIFSLFVIGIPIVTFVPLYAWKAHTDPDFCRSETHAQRVKKIEMEMMGSESKQITAESLEINSLTSSTKEPLLIEGEIGTGASQ